MLRSGLKILLVIAALGILAQSADAFGHRRGWGGGCGWGGCGYGGWGYGGYTSYGWGGWGYGGYRGYSGWGYPGYGVGVGGVGLGGFGLGSSFPAGGTLYVASAGAGARAADDSARLIVNVPAGAKVFVNDRLTSSTGTRREYASRDLKPGSTYRYNVRAEFTRNGRPVVEEKTLDLTANQSGKLDFTAPSASQTADTLETESSEVRTTLVVHVPADAQLFLAGRQTKSTGPIREFVTTALPAGSQWASYQIRAVVDINGQQEVREKTISLKAGEVRELSIDFEESRIADVR